MKVNAVKCAFSDSPRLYTYKTDLQLKKGDYVIVETPNTPFAVVRVEAFTETPIFKEEINYRWIVDTINLHRVQHTRQLMSEGV
jgi:hypothetical protein